MITSVKINKKFQIQKGKIPGKKQILMIEIRWHGRGGQGTKTAATFLAEAALKEDKFSQGFPDYGPERMGAPMRGFTRVSEDPIRIHCAIENPDIVVVLDDTLLDSVDVCSGLKSEGTLIVNTEQTPAEIKSKTKFKGDKIFTIPATQISIDELKRPIPNTPMIGALIKATDIINLDVVLENIKKKFEKKFKDEIVEGNLNAIKRAHKEVKKL